MRQNAPLLASKNEGMLEHSDPALLGCPVYPEDGRRHGSAPVVLSVSVTPKQPHDSFEDRVALDPFHHRCVLQSSL